MLLGVNIDHIAVLREARQINDPSPLDALGICKRAGAQQITIHLREDIRHIQDADVAHIMKLSSLPINLECAIEESMIDLACKFKPHRVTLVPEKREEVTTEGGLDVTQLKAVLKDVVSQLQEAGIEVSLFIDPTLEAVQVAEALGVEWVEFHTGHYANIYAMLNTNLPQTHHSIPTLELPKDRLKKMLDEELHNLRILSCDAMEMGLRVAAGHGLNYHNVGDIVAIETIEELNIGQSIIARAVFSGLEQAITDMKHLLSR